MLELAWHIQVFLHKHDRPPVSLYEDLDGGETESRGEEREGEEGERETALQDQGGGTGT